MAYTPVSQRGLPVKPPELEMGPLQTGTANSTAQTTSGGSSFLPLSILQGALRSMAETGQTFLTPTEKQPTNPKLGNILFGNEEAISPIPRRIADSELSGNNVINPIALGIIGGALDLSPLGASGKNLVKSIVKVATRDEAMGLLTRAGVADDLVKFYADDVVKATTEKEAKSLLEAINKAQTSTKYTPVLQRMEGKVPPIEKPVVKSTTEQVLESQAKNYKTPEEFVRAQKEVFHGSTSKTIETPDPKMAIEQPNTVFFTDKSDLADLYTFQREYGEILYDQPQGKVLSGYLNLKNPKIIDYKGDVGDAIRMSKDIKAAREAGHDGVIFENINDAFGGENILGTSYAVFDKGSFLSKSQLTDIWKKAQVVANELPPQANKAETLFADSDKYLPESTYAENRNVNRISTIQSVKEKISSNLSSIKETTDAYLGPISTRLKNIDPSLKIAIRNFEEKLALNTQKDRGAVVGFLKKASKMNSFDYADLDLALKNGDTAKQSALIEKYGLTKEFDDVRKTLEDLYTRAKEVGYDIGYEKNYFPRMVEDSAGLLNYLQGKSDWSIIDDAIKAKETEAGRYLTTQEKANVVNQLIRGFAQSKITLSETGAMKSRMIDVVDANLNQFYHDSSEALLRYIDDTNNAIEARKFFGKGKDGDDLVNINDSIGAYTLKLLADGKIKPSQEQELRDILHARFDPIGTSGFVRTYKNLSYIDTMGSITSAITQIGDLAYSLYAAGIKPTAKALGKALAGKSEITRTDIGIDKIAQEFSSSSTSGNAVSKVFDLIGLTKFDALGKETLINAVISKYRKLAENPTSDFVRRLESVFGDDPQKINSVIEDLRSGRATEDVKSIAFNTLLDFQPVAMSEMPEKYLTGGNGRIFYMLKTYTIKLYDVYRNEVFQQMKENPALGTANLIKLTASLVAMNATADEIKDFILNRKTSLSDRVVDNVLKLAGFSKYTIYKARQEGVVSAAAKTILPPFKLLDAAYKDIVEGNEVAKMRSLESIPIGGKLYYWWFGKGADTTAKKAGPSSSSSGVKLESPKLPELPKLPKIGK